MLATVHDMERYGFTVGMNYEVAQALLASVSAQVEEAAGAPIALTSSTITLPGTTEQFLRLPSLAVRSLTSVTLDGQVVTDAKIRDVRLWRAGGWGGQHLDVVVSYSHGLTTVPEDIVRLVCQFAALGLQSTLEADGAPSRLLAYERIDDYQAGFRTGDDEVVDVTELPQRVRESLRARFSGGARTTDNY